DYWYINDSGQLQYWTRAPYAKTIVEFYNQVYREGLLDPDSLTIDMGTWSSTKMETAVDLSFFGGWWMNWTIGNDYRAAGIPNADNMDMIPFAFTVAGGQTPKLTPVNPAGTPSAVITDNCKDPAAAMKFLDYLAKPDINFQVQNGVEGVMWSMQNGTPIMGDAFKQRWNNGESDEKFSAETGNRLYNYFDSTDVGRSPYGTYWILKDDPQVMGDARAAQRDAVFGPYWYDSYPTGGLMAGAPDDIAAIDTTVLDRFNNAFYSCVTASSQAACDQAFDQYCADLETLGLAQYEDYGNTVYQARLAQENQK
ncbi:MAG: extracellular solute-binding protein, partial [Defluviitaleaceae bacterium]|nr:extracellular solute-binding protein [Defluviitaleaceae bacterium]